MRVLRGMAYFTAWCLVACGMGEQNEVATRRAPEVQVEGITSWYSGSEIERDYLLSMVSPASRAIFDWPPPEARAVVEISIDLTGSVFSTKAIYGGAEMTRAEYNLEKLIEFLTHESVLVPGDRLSLRVFGARPDGRHITVDDRHIIELPPLQLEGKVLRLSRKHNDLHITVERISEPNLHLVPDRIRTWIEAKISDIEAINTSYQQSPLLQHIADVIGASINSRPRMLIFVTDGHFHAGNIYINPGMLPSSGALSVERITGLAVSEGITPLESQPGAAPVIFLGLDDGGDPKFRKVQEGVLSWFLENRDVSFIRG